MSFPIYFTVAQVVESFNLPQRSTDEIHFLFGWSSQGGKRGLCPLPPDLLVKDFSDVQKRSLFVCTNRESRRLKVCGIPTSEEGFGGCCDGVIRKIIEEIFSGFEFCGKDLEWREKTVNELSVRCRNEAVDRNVVKEWVALSWVDHKRN